MAFVDYKNPVASHVPFMHIMYCTHFRPAGFQLAITLSLVFATFISATTPPSDPGLDPVVQNRDAGPQLPNGWSNTGCYTDDYLMRTLTSSTYSDKSMTILFCINWCTTWGKHTYAGVENGRECYCGNTLTISSSNAPASDCTTPCIGDPTQNCGGPTSLNLFWNGQKPQPAPQMAENPSNWYLWGCYDDANNARTLKTRAVLQDGEYSNDAERCIESCHGKGFRFAGMELAIECWCDNVINYGREREEPLYCTLACPGNSLQLCGGQNSLVVYSDKPPPN